MAKKPTIRRFWWVWKGKAVRGAWPLEAPVPQDADGPFDTKAEATKHLPKVSR